MSWLIKWFNSLLHKRGAVKTDKKETVQVTKLMEKYKRWAKED